MKISIKKIYVLLFLSNALVSCQKFLDVNDDPNRITDETITPELLFKGAQVATGELAVGAPPSAQGANSALQFAYDWVGYMSGVSGFAPKQEEETYAYSNDFGNALWLMYNRALVNLYKTRQLALEEGNTLIAGASAVLSAKLFQELVDIYGQAPYTEAFQLEQFPKPRYDDGAAIYRFLQASLDSAIYYFEQPASPTLQDNFNVNDLINNGNIQKWIHLANTIKLRLLIRQSEIAGFNPSAEITRIINKGGCLTAGETVSVNPGYVNDVNKQSPYFAHYGYRVTGSAALTSTAANAYIIDLLNSSEDPRIARIFTAVSGSFAGNRFGNATIDFNGTSYFGPGLTGVTKDIGAQQRQWIVTSFESLFLQAEAIARGWIAGDAKQAYENAVKESFVWLGVADAENAANAYFNGEASSSIANWSHSGTSVTEKAKFIAVQKYIANACINPLESWSDIRRLNMLKPTANNIGYISVAPGRAGPGTLPVRLLFAQSEVSTNNENVPKNSTPFSPKIFWQP